RGRINEDRRIGLEKADPSRIDDERKKWRVPEVGAQDVDVAAPVRHDAELQTSFGQVGEHANVLRTCSPYRRGEPSGHAGPQLGTLEIEVRKLPGDVFVDHRVEVRTRDRFVHGSPRLSGVERAAKTLSRHSYTRVGVPRREA